MASRSIEHLWAGPVQLSNPSLCQYPWRSQLHFKADGRIEVSWEKAKERFSCPHPSRPHCCPSRHSNCKPCGCWGLGTPHPLVLAAGCGQLEAAVGSWRQLATLAASGYTFVILPVTGRGVRSSALSLPPPTSLLCQLSRY